MGGGFTSKPSPIPLRCRLFARVGDAVIATALRAIVDRDGGYGQSNNLIATGLHQCPVKFLWNRASDQSILVRCAQSSPKRIDSFVVITLCVCNREYECIGADEFNGPWRKSTRLNSSHLGISYA